MMDNYLSEKRILIVDDTKENIEVLGEILSSYKRSVALNGPKALKITEKRKPDLILLDIMMPDMDGFEVCRRLKANPDTKEIPVIFITAKNQVEDEVKGLELGAVDFIAKPISPPIVEARVKNHLELQDARLNLEQKNKELANTLTELKTTQNQLVHSEKMAALGQLVAGIAHEINTPLGAINSSNKAIAKDIATILPVVKQVCHTLDDESQAHFKTMIERAFAKSNSITSREERKYRRAMIKELESNDIPDADSVAEILVEMGIYDNTDDIMPLLKRPDALDTLKSARQLTGIKFSNDIINTAVDKVSKIVFSLKNFARFDSEASMKPADINESIDTVLTLYHNQMKHGVDVQKEFTISEPVPVVVDQISQVWTNIIHNALHAMNNSGTLLIRTYTEGDAAVVAIRDNGKGMPEEVKAKIFEPFFTTKPEGEGTGLGLDIVRKIIERHQGRIEVDSTPGEGTEFRIYLPTNL